MTTFFVPGKPAPQGSKKHVGKGVMVESSKYVKPWRKTISTIAKREASPLAGPVDVELTFVMPRPVATPKTRPTPPAIKRPDVDKLTRAVFDALTGFAWHDDSQVVDMRVRKRIAEIGEPTGVLIFYRPSRVAAEIDEMWAAA